MKIFNSPQIFSVMTACRRQKAALQIIKK